MIDPLDRWREHGEKPDFAGLLTYGGSPYTEDPAELEGVDVAIVGAPTDDLVSDRPGARFGPRAIRAASCPAGPHLEAGVDAFEVLRVVDFGDAPVLPADPAGTPRGDRAHRGRRPRRGGDADRPRRRSRDRRTRHPRLRRPPRPRRPRPLRHPYRHRLGRVRGRDLPRDADAEAGRSGPRRPRPLRPGRPPRLLARRGGVRLAAFPGDREHLHARAPRARHRGDGRAGDRVGGRRARPSSPSTSTSSTRRSPPAPGPRSPGG